MSTVIERLRERGLAELVRDVCAAHHVTIGQVCSRSRTAAIVAGRHAVWATIQAHCGYSSTDVGQLFGVDHSTVLHGVKKARPRLDAAEARAAMRVI